MARIFSKSQARKLYLFFNISFLFLLSFYLITNLYPSNSDLINQPGTPTTISSQPQLLNGLKDESCSDLHTFHGYKAKCAFVKSHKGCQSKGYIGYLQLFYCNCGRYPVLGYTVIFLWLALLFYLLGNTAANYFCTSLEGLSRIFNLPPTIAGITLLSLGNGAPDVFASIISFRGAGTGEVGLNSILGGAFFISSIVVGIISITISSRHISVDKSSFIRDVFFFLLSLSALLVILIIGKINIWGAIGFVSLYLVYVFVVSTTHLCRTQEKGVNQFGVTRSFWAYDPEESNELRTPLLGYMDDEKLVLTEQSVDMEAEQKPRTRCFSLRSPICYYLGRLVYILELPLYLPRRFTIPVVSEERWSKPYAVISVTLAPVLLAAIWNSQGDDITRGSKAGLVIHLVGGSVGITSGIIAFVTTEMSNPPQKCLIPWLAEGFIMSITWTYVIANELIALLLSLGNIFRIGPSILGLTVLAWGNSLGDLIANVAMAMKGGSDGAQVAISGCYAGPIFNTLIGLGLSFVLSSWSVHPSPYVIPKDPSLYETMGFLVSGLLWALLILPRRKMRLEKFFGVGLLAIYLCFLSVRLVRALGLV